MVALARYARPLLLLLFALMALSLLVGLIPLSTLDAPIEKTLFTAGGSALLLIWIGAYLLSLGRQRVAHIRSADVFALLFLPLLALALSARGGVTLDELTGLAFEPDSLAALFAFAVWGIAGALALRALPLRIFSAFLEAGLLLLSLSWFAGGMFLSASDHYLFGDPFTQSLAIATLLFIPLLPLLLDPLSPARKTRNILLVSIALAALFLSPYSSLQLSLAGTVLVALAASFFIQPRLPSGDFIRQRRHGRFTAIIAALLLLTGAWWGPSAASELGLTDRPGQVRLSAFATASAIAELYAKSAPASLFGVGAHGFASVWNSYRPPGANTTALWDTDIHLGSGLLLTLAGTLGAPAVFLILLLVFVFGALTVIRVLRGARAAAGPATAAIFALACLIVVPPTLHYLALAGMLLGCCLGSRKLPKEERTDRPDGQEYWRIFSTGVLAVLFIVAGAIALVAVNNRGAALSLQSEAASILDRDGDLTRARESLVMSYNRDTFALNARMLALVDRESARLIAEEGSGDLESLSAINAYLTEAKAAATDAMDADPRDFRNTLERAYVHTIIALITRDVAEFNQALGFYQDAVTLAPRHPLPYFGRAQALALGGQQDEALETVNQALRLKPNYDEALALQERLRGSLTSPRNQ